MNETYDEFVPLLKMSKEKIQKSKYLDHEANIPSSSRKIQSV